MSVIPPTLRPGKIDFDALMDESERRELYHTCPECGDLHMLCPECGVSEILP